MYLHQSRPERELEILRKALFEGRIIEIGPTQFRWLHAGEEFEHDSEAFEALESGVYMTLEVVNLREGWNGQQAKRRWVFAGHMDHLDNLLAPHLDALPALDREAITVGIAASNALRSLRA